MWWLWGKSTPFDCKGCGQPIYIYYNLDGSIRGVFSAKQSHGGVSTEGNWVLHRIANPSCEYKSKRC
ncbi:MAG: hypothetical protein QF454_00270 [Candidatus Thalassarchaeaceae archaeon]|nr:hypothetical protein [Candidatus Thalassarchaeaceae archaeon]